MGSGMVLAVVMACFAILLIAKAGAPVNDEAATVIYTRDQMVGPQTSSVGWAFAVILLAVLFLAIVLAG
jgi:ABC-type sugar transport system permease subunit